MMRKICKFLIQKDWWSSLMILFKKNLSEGQVREHTHHLIQMQSDMHLVQRMKILNVRLTNDQWSLTT